MDVSVVIPTYNKLVHLKAALQALEMLDFPRDSFEVVVVDDGSTEVGYSDLSPEKFQYRLRIVRHTNNRGRAAARNSGVWESQGRILVLLDDDMRVAPGFLKAHVQHHGGQGGRVIIGNVRRSEEVTPTALVKYLDSRGVHKLKQEEPVPFRYFATGNVSLEKELLVKVGLFDERFREFGGEDLELGYRLHLVGTEFIYAEEALSFRSDYRDIQELCKAMEMYGEYSLPIIIDTHPELKKLFKVHLIESTAIISESIFLTLKRILLSFLLWRQWGKLMPTLIGMFNNLFVPTILFDYLIFYYYSRGFLQTCRRSNKR